MRSISDIQRNTTIVKTEKDLKKILLKPSCRPLSINFSKLDINDQDILRLLAKAFAKMNVVFFYARITNIEEIFNWHFPKSLLNILSTNTTLLCLDLKHTIIASTELQVLLKSPMNLRSLYLHDCYILDEGAKIIAKILSTNTSLTKLDLSRNWLTYTGISDLSLALERNTVLTALDLSDNLLGNARNLSLSLVSHPNKFFTVPKFPYVQEKNDSICSIAQVLYKNTTLTTLILHNMRGAIENEIVSIAQALFTNHILTHLDISDNMIREEGVNAIAEALKYNTSLKCVNFSYSIERENMPQIVAALSQNTSITKLDLANIGTKGSLIEPVLLRTTSLTQLDLSFNSIEGEGAISIAKALRTNTSLTSLNLLFNSINPMGIKEIALSLHTNTSLATLDLYANTMGFEGVNSLAEALCINTSLATLDLGAIHLDSAGSKALFAALHANTSLTALKLEANNIKDQGVDFIAEALYKNTSLASLDLAANEIGPEGITSLGKSLRVNTSLTSLKLDNINIDTVGFEQFVDALKHNVNLFSLICVPFKNLDPSLPNLIKAEKISGRHAKARHNLLNFIYNNFAENNIPKEGDVGSMISILRSLKLYQKLNKISVKTGLMELSDEASSILNRVNYYIYTHYFLFAGICKYLNPEATIAQLPTEVTAMIVSYLGPKCLLREPLKR